MLTDILTLDRKVTLLINGSDSALWDEFNYVATSTIAWIPLGLLLLWLLWRDGGRRQLLTVVLLLVLGILISDQLSSNIFKPFFQRWRPAQDPVYGYLFDTVHGYKGGKYGFFSAHASNTFSVAILLCYLIRQKWTNTFIISWSLLNCYTRVYLGVHYVGDILVGLCFGYLIGYGLYRIYVWRICGGHSPAPRILTDASCRLLGEGILASYLLVFIIAVIRFCS